MVNLVRTNGSSILVPASYAATNAALDTPIMGKVGRGEQGPARLDTWTMSGLTLPESPQVGAHGDGVQSLRVVLNNPYYEALVDQRKEVVTEAPWVIEAASEDDNDALIADFVRWCLDALPGSFTDEFRAFLSALDWGYSIHEMVWERGSTPFGDRVFLAKLADKPQWQYGFKLDQFNNIEKIGLWNRIRLTQSNTDDMFDPEDFVVVTYRARAESPYGSGLLRQCFWPDQFNRVGMKMWATFLERFGSPLPIAFVPPDTSLTDRTAAEEIVSNLMQQSWAVMTEGQRIEFVESSGRSGGGYDQFISEAKELMQLSILGQTLTSSEGEHGTQALGTVHKDMLDSKAAADREMVFAKINEEVIPRLVRVNFPGVTAFPKIVPFKGEPEDLGQRAENVKVLRSLGLDLGLNWVRDYLGTPVPGKDEELLAKPAPPPMAPSPSSDADADEKNGRDDVEAAMGAGGVATFATKKFRRKLTVFEDERTLVKLSDVADRDVTPAIDASSEILTMQRDAIIGIVRKAGGVDMSMMRDDTFAVSEAKSRKALGDIVQRTIVVSNAMGQVDATDEIRRKGNDVPAKFAMDLAWIWAAFAELPLIPPQDAIDAITAKTPLTKRQLSTIKREARDQAFWVSGEVSGEVVTQAQRRVLEGVQNGTGTEQFVSNFTNDIKAFTAAGVPVDPALAAVPRLETIFRNNVAGAYNQGRKELFFESGEVGDFVTHLQYSAILDDRVRDDHAAMDGLIYAKGDPIWDVWYPLNGHRCRCLVFPVTKAESEAGLLLPKDISTTAPVVGGTPATPDKGFGSG